MKKENKHELYESPEVEVMEVNAQQVMCTSPEGQLGSMNNGQEEW